MAMAARVAAAAAVAVVLCCLLGAAPARAEQYEGYYCGEENCYEVLGVERDVKSSKLRKAYRRLAAKLHPDVNPSEEAARQFRRVATAYEILKDEEGRTNYDYMLDNPDEYYENMYRYYKHKAAPKVGVLPIVLVMLSVTSVCQYLYRLNRSTEVVDEAYRDHKQRVKAKHLADQRGLLKKKQSKAEVEEIVKGIVRETLPAHLIAKPKIQDVLWAQLLLLPLTVGQYLVWQAHWYYRIHVQGGELTETDKDYLVRRNFGLSSTEWASESDEFKQFCLEQELWVPANYDAYQAAQREQRKQKERQSGRYKQEKRWAKRGGGAPENYND